MCSLLLGTRRSPATLLLTHEILQESVKVLALMWWWVGLPSMAGAQRPVPSMALRGADRRCLWKGTVASQTAQISSLALWLCHQRFCSDPNPGHTVLSHHRPGWLWTGPSKNVSWEKHSLWINRLSLGCFPSGESRSVQLPRKGTWKHWGWKGLGGWIAQWNTTNY